MSQRMETVKAILAGFLESGSLEELLAADADVVLKNAIPESAPFGGEFRGRQGILDYFARVDTVLEPQRVRATDYLEGGDKVVVLGDERLRIKSTGETFASEWCTVFEFRGDRVARITVIEDHSPFYASFVAGRQAGVVEAESPE